MSDLRIPRDRRLTWGQMLSMVCTVGVFVWGALYVVVKWALS